MSSSPHVASSFVILDAQKNRAEWKANGEEIVEKMIRQVRTKYGVKGADGQIVKEELQEQALPQRKLSFDV